MRVYVWWSQMCHILYFTNIKEAADVYVVTYVDTRWLHCPLK